MQNAQALSEALVARGYQIVSGGTDNHCFLIDLRNKKISGKKASEMLDRLGITVNANSVPFDTGSALDPSGMRIGTPACTTRGMKESEFQKIADVIDQAISNPTDEVLHQKLRKQTMELCEAFPLYSPMMKQLYGE